MRYLRIKKEYQRTVHRGSALVLTMFIMAGMLIVAMSGMYVVLLSIRASGTQSESTRAYFVAEAGAEHLLWELRKNDCQFATPSCTLVPSSSRVIFSDTLLFGSYAAPYQVFYTGFPPLIFQSVGQYQNTRRSVELRI